MLELRSNLFPTKSKVFSAIELYGYPQNYKCYISRREINHGNATSQEVK